MALENRGTGNRASAAYQSDMATVGRRLMQSIMADYIECLTAPAGTVHDASSCQQQQQHQWTAA